MEGELSVRAVVASLAVVLIAVCSWPTVTAVDMRRSVWRGDLAWPQASPAPAETAAQLSAAASAAGTPQAAETAPAASAEAAAAVSFERQPAAGSDMAPPASVAPAPEPQHTAAPVPVPALSDVPDAMAAAAERAQPSLAQEDGWLGPRAGLHLPIAQVCAALAEAARAEDIPVPFFARLIWAESSFRPNLVSRAGAQGIAQFMPGTADEVGLDNPFDPLQALPASAKFLASLLRHFGNLGLAAAAYNAGARRITDWLALRGKLPTETRNYVRKITGHEPEAWTVRKPIEMAAHLPERAPCEGVAGLSRTRAAERVDVEVEAPVAKLIAEARSAAAKAMKARAARLASAKAAKASGSAETAVKPGSGRKRLQARGKPAGGKQRYATAAGRRG
jgi:soluble lytic murein transglycosylase-like protein